MKRLISTHSLAWIVAIAGTCAVLPAWAADLKIGVVDYGKLMEESPQAKVVVEAIRTEFTPRQRQTAIKLAAILRLANAFDAERDGRIERLACVRQNGFLLIRAQAYNPRDRLAETIAGSRHLLETVYRRPVVVKPLRRVG